MDRRIPNPHIPIKPKHDRDRKKGCGVLLIFGFLNFQIIKKMISDLSFITLDDLCNSLEKPTRNWEELMQSNIFRYPDRVINKIREKDHPAKALMDEFSCQMTTLQDLLSGLKEIGNKKAISIIEKGSLSGVSIFVVGTHIGECFNIIIVKA